MLKLVSDLLAPIFVNMGAQATDVENYVNQCGGYVYGLLAAIAALSVLMVASHWFKK